MAISECDNKEVLFPLDLVQDSLFILLE